MLIPKLTKQSGEKPLKEKVVGGRKTKSGSVMPSEADVAAALEIWNTYCRSLQDTENCPVPIGHVRPRVALLEGDDDLGMDRFRGMKTEELWARLGLPGATNFPFAALGDGTTPAIVPKWHQIVGASVILSNAFTAEAGMPALPTLICDDVGLGKTLQIVEAACMIVHMREQQENHPNKLLVLPPFALGELLLILAFTAMLTRAENKTHFFAGLTQIPNRPNIVVVMRTLSSQWLKEVQKYTVYGSFHVLRYSSDQQSLARFFSDPKGEYCKAAGPNGENASRVFIVAEHSVRRPARTVAYN